MMRELRRHSFWRAMLAEFLGVTIFVFLSTGSATKWTGSHVPADIVQIALTFGLSIATLAQCVGHISGAHLNPAVTVGLLVGCRLSVVRALAYIGCQMLGAVTASAILLGVTPTSRNSTLGLNALADGVTPGQGLGIELIITFQLVLCVFATTDKRRSDLSGSGPLAIGLSVAIGHLMAIGFTGCGMNPARSFGPAAVTGDFKDHWLYWVGPMIGGVAAALLYDFVLTTRYRDTSERLKVLTSGPADDYDVESEQDSARIEMKPK
ncbi:LOW QUALITY PROTEIN: aquaporin-1-like [Pristis pectinata]|uniref:LOW QUALITY PROTEIN: aquaporin-1-like n=1 Tax=Pristis pectinata TaxID=685728 RepID=UPI00223D8E09|nr:LOW QUALITY PROTEIN: aquaporin-1-like [Pristis pectinata]